MLQEILGSGSSKLKPPHWPLHSAHQETATASSLSLYAPGWRSLAILLWHLLLPQALTKCRAGRNRRDSTWTCRAPGRTPRGRSRWPGSGQALITLGSDAKSLEASKAHPGWAQKIGPPSTGRWLGAPKPAGRHTEGPQLATPPPAHPGCGPRSLR